MKYPTMLTSVAALAVLAAPAQAQDPEGSDAPPVYTLRSVPDPEPNGNQPVPVFQTEEEEATEALAAEITDAFAVVGELFKADPLTPEQEARLPLAKELSAAALPQGSLGSALETSLTPMMQKMMSIQTLDKRGELSRLTGVERDELEELDDKSVNKALDIFDPDFEARNKALIAMSSRMLTQLFEAMEPAYTEAIARAYAVRFTEAELRDILAFAGTESGRKFAEFGFVMQFDPQIIAAVEAMGPAMAKVLPDLIKEAIEVEEKMPAAFSYIELTPLERETVAKLLGKSQSELEALAPVQQGFEEDTGDAVI